MSEDLPADLAETTYSELEPVQQLAVAAHLQSRTLAEWGPHVLRSLESGAAADLAAAERDAARTEAWRALAGIARHPVVRSAVAIVVLAWGVGSAVWATGIDPAALPGLLPSVTWGSDLHGGPSP